MEQIEFVHPETRGGVTDYYPGVIAPEHTSFPYNAQPQGEDPIYTTLEEASHAEVD